MRPLFGPAGMDFVGASPAWLITGAGGASAAAISGLDSVGGGGALSATAGGAGVFDGLGSLTVADGLAGDSGVEVGLISFFKVCPVDAFCGG